MSDFDWLFGLEQFGIKFGLDNMRAIVGPLGHPERAFTSIHVAGTNGKGSVTAMVDAALGAAGHRSARYTSPHLLDLTERFVVGGRAVDEAALTAAAAAVRTVVDDLSSSGQLPVHPTFFEVTTAIAFEIFRRAEVEIAVCEVGLGGRLDATNVLLPAVTAITSIGIDHEQFLGRTLEAIAIEKAGIIKPGVPVIVGRMAPEPFEAIERVARERGAPLTRAWDRAALRAYGDPPLALQGDHQIDNAVVAIRVLEALNAERFNVPGAAIVEGLTHVRWPGRLDLRRSSDGREVLLDAAHNPDGARALAAFLTSNFTDKPPLVFAVMRDKNAGEMLKELVPHISSLVLTKASTPRALDPSDLAPRVRAAWPDLPTVVEPSPAAAMAAAWRVAPRIVAAGSIFLLADIVTALKQLGPSWYPQA